MATRGILIAGAGPAGSAAALSALAEGAAVRIAERSRVARHKVCGEFIPHEAFAVLDKLGVGEAFQRLQPATIRNCVLHFGNRAKRWRLEEAGFSLTRLALDALLLDRAAAAGATVSRGVSAGAVPPRPGDSLVVAYGRRGTSATPRLFGFKAHFEGAVNDAVELFFTKSGYLGVSAVENGGTNVCGIAPEDALKRCGFDLDEFVDNEPAVRETLRPLRRRMRWLTVGPLAFSRVDWSAATNESVYPAGDALGFIDPFTGSGICNALVTGRLAGIAAARG
jgi:flavin-dependent dehydrogenase